MLDHLTTYPLQMAVSKSLVNSEASKRPQKKSLYLQSIERNLDVEIGHDVWIGTRAIIMAGVTIGTGAVIGAGAVVTKDVPPYGIAVGVPATTDRFRHEEKTIERILDSKWWELEPDQIWEAVGNIFDYEDVQTVLDSLDRLRERGDTPAAATISAEPSSFSHLAALSDAELAARFERGDNSLPQWPSEEEQLRYTGGKGASLVKRARDFVSVMESDGALREDWKGLDYGCGWGRIAAFLLTKGTPDQLDLCDAWPDSTEHIERGRFRNHFWQVGEVLAQSDIPPARYDFIYAFSVFTHLNKETFENNIVALLRGLKPDGTLYFTVRHEDFVPVLEKRKLSIEFDPSGFWNTVYDGQKFYGETVVTKGFMESTIGRRGTLRYLGTSEAHQHIYALNPRMG